MRSKPSSARVNAATLVPTLAFAALVAGCGTPAIDAMRVKALSLPGDGSFCVRRAMTLPLTAMMDDGTRRTIDPEAPRAQRFDPGVLEWTTSIGTVRVVRSGVLSPRPDYAEYVPPEREADLLEQDVKVAITMKGNPFLKSELELKADFSCPAAVDFSGPPGSAGASGPSGGGGAAGGNGGPGSPGGNAGPVEVFLAPLETDRRGTLIQVRVDGSSNSAAMLLSPNGRLQVGARGGEGGPGGSGGAGGRGTDKGQGCGDGGAGGPGGNGGNGGPGGQGGAVLVHVDDGHPEWAKLVDVDNGPGEGGRGGPGGPGGGGGSPGRQPDGPNQGQTCGGQGSTGSNGATGSEGPSGSAGPPPRVVVEHLTAGMTAARHAAETAPPPPSPDSPEVKAAEGFWASMKGPHVVRVTNGTSALVCSLTAEAAPDPKASATADGARRGKPDKSRTGDKPSTPPPSRINVLTTPLKPGETRDIGHVGGAGSFPLVASSCDGKLQATFHANRDRDTTVSLQPAGKAPKAGQGVAVFLVPVP